MAGGRGQVEVRPAGATAAIARAAVAGGGGRWWEGVAVGTSGWLPMTDRWR